MLKDRRQTQLGWDCEDRKSRSLGEEHSRRSCSVSKKKPRYVLPTEIDGKPVVYTESVKFMGIQKKEFWAKYATHVKVCGKRKKTAKTGPQFELRVQVCSRLKFWSEKQIFF